MKCSLAKTRTTDGAIRPLDVTAIVCVVAVLGFLAVMGGQRFRQHSLLTRCQANLRQFGQALELYAKANHDMLPDCSVANRRYFGAIWPWDISTNLTHDLEAFGMTRAAFYCPANPEMNDDLHWNFQNGPMRIVSYPTLFKGVRTVPRTLWREKLVKTGGSQAELSCDATAALDNDFTKIQGDYRDHSSHISGGKPLGGNILFLDEHVEWRDFDKMQVRLRSPGTGGNIEWSF